MFSSGRVGQIVPEPLAESCCRRKDPNLASWDIDASRILLRHQITGCLDTESHWIDRHRNHIRPNMI